MKPMRVLVNYYEQFDADFTRAVPAEGYGGWKKTGIELCWEHTAVVIMHAWECGTRDQYPGWHRAAEWIPRAQEICQRVFPKLLAAVRDSGLKIFHVVSGGSYLQKYPGYKETVALAGAEPAPVEKVPPDPQLERIWRFKSEHVSPGAHNAEDSKRGMKLLDFPPEAKPLPGEPIAKTSHQLFSLCKHHGVNHLIYAGFTLNGCMQLSAGGMFDMRKHGILCSVLRQAVTAIENKETAARELCKEVALWQLILTNGLVFDVEDFIDSLKQVARSND